MNALKHAEEQMLNKFFSIHGSIKTPDCDICQKPCEKFGVSYRPLERNYVFEVQCHGDRGEIYIDEGRALDPKMQIVAQKAFTPNQSRYHGIIQGEIN